MSWEKRGNRKYYYKKKRIGSKVKSIYIGSGPAVEKIAQEDELAKRKRVEEKLAWQHQQMENGAIDSALDCLENITKFLIHAHLLVAGYHTHKGQWRKKRHG